MFRIIDANCATDAAKHCKLYLPTDGHGRKKYLANQGAWYLCYVEFRHGSDIENRPTCLDHRMRAPSSRCRNEGNNALLDGSSGKIVVFPDTGTRSGLFCLPAVKRYLKTHARRCIFQSTCDGDPSTLQLLLQQRHWSAINCAAMNRVSGQIAKFRTCGVYTYIVLWAQSSVVSASQKRKPNKKLFADAFPPASRQIPIFTQNVTLSPSGLGKWKVFYRCIRGERQRFLLVGQQL